MFVIDCGFVSIEFSLKSTHPLLKEKRTDVDSSSLDLFGDVCLFSLHVYQKKKKGHKFATELSASVRRRQK